jgi:hypothetical protein
MADLTLLFFCHCTGWPGTLPFFALDLKLYLFSLSNVPTCNSTFFAFPRAGLKLYLLSPLKGRPETLPFFRAFNGGRGTLPFFALSQADLKVYLLFPSQGPT